MVSRASPFLLLSAVAVAQAALDTCAIAKTQFGNDSSWYVDRIPFFESSDTALTEVYYYRQKIFRAHQRDTGSSGYISTEFLDDVGWQTAPWGSLNDASGMHLLEGRWNRDRRFKEEYAKFMYGTSASPRQYSESIAASIWQGYLVDGVSADVTSYLDAMKTVYSGWESDRYDTSKGMFWIEPLQDATEYTIASIDASCGQDGFTGGQSFRPSINSYQYANALAISNIATLSNDATTADTYKAKAAVLKGLVQDNLWNSTFEHFIDRHYAETDCVSYWEPIRGRELVGYVPWTHDLPDDNTTYANAWSHLTNSSLLMASHGLRTVEPSYEYYNKQYRYDAPTGLRECQWNGPAWPYQTTQVLTGLANVLDHYDATSGTGTISKSDYTDILIAYAKLHYNPNRGNTLVLEEDYDGDTGAPIVGLPRSAHYFHSSFIDQILSGLVGIRPRADDVLEVNPLASSDITYFRVENVLYHGNNVTVQWDATGSKYGSQGLIVEVNGAQVASSPTLSRVTTNVSRVSPPVFTEPEAISIQANDDGSYPRGNVSTADADNAKVHDTIDGRVFFFTETDYAVAHGYETPKGDGTTEYWYQIDFGTTKDFTSSEIAFFADDAQAVAVPVSYKVEVYQNDVWVEVTSPSYDAPVASGITRAAWEPTSAQLVRLTFTPQSGSAVRLAEWKVFDGLVSSPTSTCS